MKSGSETGRGLKEIFRIVYALLIFFPIVAHAQSNGVISGRVTNGAGAGIEGVKVIAEDSDVYNLFINEDDTDVNGNYTIKDLPAGNVKIVFVGGYAGYIAEWYNDKIDFDSADPVAVTAGGTTVGIDAVLEIGGTVSGRITDGRGVGVQSVLVAVVDRDNNHIGLWNYTDGDGNYKIVGLPPGNVYMFFNGYDAGYVSEWYNDKTDLNSADPIMITKGGVTIGIDAVLELGGTVAGRVTNGEGAGIQWVRVIVKDSNDIAVGSSVTKTNGEYNINALPAGNFKIFFDGSNANYLSRWYDDKIDFDRADPIAVKRGEVTPNIDVVLRKNFQFLPGIFKMLLLETAQFR